MTILVLLCRASASTVTLCGLEITGCAGGSLEVTGSRSDPLATPKNGLSSVQLFHVRFSGSNGAIASAISTRKADLSITQSSLSACSCEFQGDPAGGMKWSISLEDSSVSIRQGVFAGGPGKGGGGAIYSVGKSSLAMIDTTFANFSAAAEGVVLLRAETSFHCVGCAWSDITGSYPAIQASLPAKFDIIDSSFTRCYRLGYGGAIYIDYSGAESETEAYFERVNFTSCRATDQGGALHVKQIESEATAAVRMREVLFQGCQVRYLLGAALLMLIGSSTENLESLAVHTMLCTADEGALLQTPTSNL
jgi:hypothetical protein